MLEEITIRDYALIDSVTQSFDEGFTALTGETGAGKSIIVGSLSFLLGGKAEAEVIRSGREEASVSAVVRLSPGPGGDEAREWLAGRGIESDEGRVILRRSLRSSGRSAMYIQNVPVTRADLASFAGLLFDLHGQHSHESLLRRETHRRYLDHFAGLEEEADAFSLVFQELSARRKALESSLNLERDRETRLEVLRYGAEEIGKARLKPGESGELEIEAKRLGDFEKLSACVSQGAEALYRGEDSALSLSRKARVAFETAASIDRGLAPLLKRVEDLFYEAEDLSGEFRSYLDGLSFDPARLEAVEERLALIQRLRKKYAPSFQSGGPMTVEEAIIAWKTRAEEDIEALEGASESREALRGEIASLEKELRARASSLTASRVEAAKRLGAGITGILARLGMPRARFQAAVSPKGAGGGGNGEGGATPGAGAQGRTVLGPYGADEVEFLISANPGEPLKDLSRIASGGELSRVTLAIKTILLSDSPGKAGGGGQAGGGGGADTLVFDEIDTGIGGEVALAVGDYLSQIGSTRQIFCVTHLASIACRAKHHLMVKKRVEGDRTFTGIETLDGQGRVREIARMLAGEAGEAALAHAGELLARYGEGGTK